MVDLSKTILAKSDQLNADDLIEGDLTLTIVRVEKGAADQPVHIFYQNSGKKSFRPCKSMRRVLLDVWGPEATTFVGKSLTVFRDPKVLYGGEAVGGVRISHMSHINEPKKVSLIITKGRRGLYTVQPLRVSVQTPEEQREENPPANSATAPEDRAAVFAGRLIQQIQTAQDEDALKVVTSGKAFVDHMPRLRTDWPELAGKIDAALKNALDKFDPFAGAA